MPPFEEWESCVAAGLDLYRWDNGEYDKTFMARVIAWYQLHLLTELHKDDVLATKAEQDARKKR